MSADTTKLRLNHAASRIAAHVRPFYRRFPYSGPMGFFKVDTRGAYSPNEPFFYNRVPKAANSTIIQTLRGLSDYRRPFSRADDPKDHFLRPSYMSGRDVDRMVNQAFKFTVVRDPYSRVLSAYQSKILGNRPQSVAFRDWQRNGQAPSFAAFCRFLDDGFSHYDMHWAPQADIMVLPLEMFDFIGKVETLDADLNHIRTQIFGAKAGTGMDRAGKITGASDKVAQAYGPEEFEIITRLYARDFDAFGYERRNR